MTATGFVLLFLSWLVHDSDPMSKFRRDWRFKATIAVGLPGLVLMVAGLATLMWKYLP